MRINLEKFRESLPKPEAYQQSFTSGLFRAIDVALHYENSSSVDWSSFSLAEAEEALDHIMNYADSEQVAYDDSSDSECAPNEGNAIHEYLHTNGVIYSFKKLYPEKQTENLMFF